MKISAIRIFIAAFTIFFLSSCSSRKFITTTENNFIKNGKPYHYIGANYWYGAMLGAKPGDRARLIKELDELKAHGITNLRILASSEGGDQDFTVRPATQYQQGKYTPELLEGLDFVLAEMRKRNMDAVLYLTNNWEWSGGIAKYLEWNGYGTVPNPNLSPNTWPQFMAYTDQFQECKPCKEAFLKHIRFMVGRTNSVNGVKYSEDQTIMSWEVANEPRIGTAQHEAAFTKWLNDVATTIKKLDKNHLVTTGSEGKAGSNDDIQAFERTHNSPNIDYLTMHIWPKNWGWYNIDDEKNSTQTSISETVNYMKEHIEVAKSLKKPLVLEEFGFPRTNESLSKSASVENRNTYYKAIFEEMEKSIAKKEPFTALNIWGYGGLGKNNPADGKWKEGDDYTADPPQEPQGLNSIFSTDTTTLDLIKEFNQKINQE